MKLNRKRLGLLLLAILLIVSSWWGLAVARSGLEVRSLRGADLGLSQDDIPLLYLAPQGAQAVPGVLVAHGFAGSKQLMLGYGHVLAQAGYAVMLWDFDGHGANDHRLQQGDLQHNLEAALQALLAQPEVDPNRLALLGHSMGSGVVMTAGVKAPDRFTATVAVSPTGAEITPRAPKNLQLQAGGGEGRFIANAERLLARAGGENSRLAAGRGRELVVVPNVEHITILFSDGSHQAARRWLDAAFENTPNSRYVDRRMAWYGLHLLGWLVALAAAAPLWAQAAVEPAKAPIKTSIPSSPAQRWGGLIIAPPVATAGLVLLSQRLALENLGGVQVGGAVGVWFLIAGLTWLSVLGRLPRITLRAVGLGIALFVILWVAFGAMAQVVWLQWWLIPIRLRVWLPIAIASLPWFLAAGIVQQNIGIGKRILWWLGQSVLLIGGFVLTLNFLPQLGFMFLLLPLFPPLMGVLALIAGLFNQPWSYAIGTALFFGWLLAAGFPLSA